MVFKDCTYGVGHFFCIGSLSYFVKEDKGAQQVRVTNVDFQWIG